MQLLLVFSGLFAAVSAQTVCVAPSDAGEKISKNNIKSTANVVLSGDSGENFSKPFAELTAADMKKMMENGYCESKRTKRETGDKTVDRPPQKFLPARAKTTQSPPKTPKAPPKTTKTTARTTQAPPKTPRAPPRTTQAPPKTTKATARTTKPGTKTTKTARSSIGKSDFSAKGYLPPPSSYLPPKKF